MFKSPMYIVQSKVCEPQLIPVSRRGNNMSSSISRETRTLIVITFVDWYSDLFSRVP